MLKYIYKFQEAGIYGIDQYNFEGRFGLDKYLCFVNQDLTNVQLNLSFDLLHTILIIYCLNKY